MGKIRKKKEKYNDEKDRKAVVSMVSRSARKILDIGTGDCCCMAQLLAKKRFKVVAVDKSRRNLKKAGKEAKQNRVSSHIDFQLADATELPYPDNYFSVIIAFNSMHHVKRKEEAIKEMCRVCRKTGKVIIADLNPRGRKVSGHKKDDKFLDNLQRTLKLYFKIIRRINNKYTATFVARPRG